MDAALFSLTVFFSSVTTVGYLSHLVWSKKPLWKAARTLLVVGFLLQTASIVTRHVEAGYTPITNRFESLSFFPWLPAHVWFAFLGDAPGLVDAVQRLFSLGSRKG